MKIPGRHPGAEPSDPPPSLPKVMMGVALPKKPKPAPAPAPQPGGRLDPAEVPNFHAGTWNPNLGKGALITAIATGIAGIIGATVPIVKALGETRSTEQDQAIHALIDAQAAELARLKAQQAEASEVLRIEVARNAYLTAWVCRLNKGAPNESVPCDSVKWEPLPQGVAEPLNLSAKKWPKRKDAWEAEP